MSAQASPEQLNRFVEVVDEFMHKYDRLIAPDTRAQVYATRDPRLIGDYETAVRRGGLLKRNIEAVTGAWKAAKDFYAEATQQTSIWIGDAIDEVRSWFGYKPGGVGGLGVVQIPAAVWVAGTIAAAVVLIKSINKVFVLLEASELQRENPGMPRAVALSRASDALDPGFFAGLRGPLLIAAAAAGYWLVTR